MPSADDELEQWAREVLPRAVAYARTLLNPPAEAEDVVQDVLCRLLDHDEYDLPADGEKLLFRSITNACINAVTRRRQLASLDGAEHPPLQDPLSASTPRDPAEVTASREVLDTVEDELKELPEMQRAAVELKALGRSLKHIADVLEVSASNAGVLVHRGRKKLRSRLGDKLPGELV